MNISDHGHPLIFQGIPGRVPYFDSRKLCQMVYPLSGNARRRNSTPLLYGINSP